MLRPDCHPSVARSSKTNLFLCSLIRILPFPRKPYRKISRSTTGVPYSCMPKKHILSVSTLQVKGKNMCTGSLCTLDSMVLIHAYQSERRPHLIIPRPLQYRIRVSTRMAVVVTCRQAIRPILERDGTQVCVAPKGQPDVFKAMIWVNVSVKFRRQID